MEARRYLQLEIARKFTRLDGSSSLYVAQESVFPGLSAWPVPHDAPYKPVLDRAIMAVKEVCNTPTQTLNLNVALKQVIFSYNEQDIF